MHSDNLLYNILDQNDDSSLAAMISAFDLSSEEGLESPIEKISFLYSCFRFYFSHKRIYLNTVLNVLAHQSYNIRI